MKNAASLIGSFLLLPALTLCLTGCPKQVNQAREGNSNLGAVSRSWGVPVIRTSTAGFNGSPSGQVGAPSNSTSK